MDSIKQSIQRFFKTKSVGYYIVMGVALLAIFLAIFFFSTYNNPAFNGEYDTPPMGNKSVGLAIETIGIFIIAGAVIEVVVLIMPEFRFFHLAAIVMFGLAIYKDVILIADFIAGMANDVMYNGGNLGLNLFIAIALIVIEIAAVVASFIGFIKEDAAEQLEEEEE